MGCRSEENSSLNYKHKKLSLLPKDSLQIEVDNEFIIDEVSGFFYDDEIIDRYTVKSKRNIYQLDLEGGILRREKLASEGPKGIKTVSDFDGVGILENGSIIYSNHFLNRIEKLDKEKIQTIYEINEENANERLHSSWFSPVINTDRYILFPKFGNWRTQLTDLSCFVLLVKESLLTKDVIKYPLKYEDYHWGDHPYLYWANIQYIKAIGKYYVSFPIENYVRIYDQNFNYVGKKLVRSHKIEQVAPMFNEKIGKEEEPDHIKDRAYFKSLSFYIGALYDPIHRIYYRIALIAESNELNEIEYSYSFVVCDYDLNYIGEWEVPQYYKVNLSFISPGGVSLFNEKRYLSEREFSLPYDVFLPDNNVR